MIRLIENGEMFSSIACDNLFKAKICSIYKTYGFTRFTDYWQGDAGILIARLDNNFTISAQRSSDELTSFIDIMCHGKVMCGEGMYPPVKNCKYGEIMSLDRVKNSTYDIDFDMREDLYPREVYGLLSTCFEMPDYESFSADMFHRINKGTSVCIGAYDKAKLVSCAFAMVANESAIIYSVAVDSKYRRMGLGTATVLQLLEKLRSYENIFLQRADGENERFYEKMGFINKGKWMEITGDR